MGFEEKWLKKLKNLVTSTIKQMTSLVKLQLHKHFAHFKDLVKKKKKLPGLAKSMIIPDPCPELDKASET